MADTKDSVTNFYTVQLDGETSTLDTTAVKVLLRDSNGNPILASGATVPSDNEGTGSSSGFAKGCIFIQTDGGVGTTLYMNEGTYTNCDFNAITTSAIGTFAGLTDVMAGAITFDGVVTGHDAGISIDLSSNGLLTLAADGGNATGDIILNTAVAKLDGKLVGHDADINIDLSSNGILALASDTSMTLASTNIGLTGITGITGATTVTGTLAVTDDQTMTAGKGVILRAATEKVYSSGVGKVDIDGAAEVEITAPTTQIVATTILDLDAGSCDIDVGADGTFDVLVATQDTNATAGGEVKLVAGAGLTTGAGGATTLTSGAGGNDGVGGAMTLTAGAAGGGNRAGGAASLIAGAGAGSAAGGAIIVTAGAAGATGTGGQAEVKAGAGGGTSGTGGAAKLTGGATATSGTGGAATVQAGASTTAGNGGAASLLGGAATTGDGGAVTITAGSSATLGAGGAVSITAGTATTDGNGGAVSITGGAGGNAGDGGNITLTPGAKAGGGTDGIVSIVGGARMATTNKLEFRDTGIFIQSGADGKLTISADGVGTDDITISGAITLDDDLITPTNKKVQFRDSALYISSKDDGHLDIDADTSIDMNGPVLLAGATNTFGTSSAHVTTNVGRMVVRTINHATPTGNVAGSLAEIAFNSNDSKFYGCTTGGDAAGSVWAAFT